MPSIEQEPLPRDALSSARLRSSPASQLGHRDSGSRRLFTPQGPWEPSRARSPSTRPAASGRHASLDLGVACRLLQPENDARAHPTSVRPSHASGAFAPLLAGTNRCRLRWSTMRRRTGDLRASIRHAPACARCVPLGVDRADRGPKRSSKGEPRALGRCRACPPRDAPGTRVAGSIGGEVWRTSPRLAPT